MKISWACSLSAATTLLAPVWTQPALLAPAPGSPITVAGGPGNIVLGDVNEDGKPDLIVASGQSRAITVWLGRGNGQFRSGPKSPIRVPDSPGELALGDLNGDGELDLAIASHDSYGVWLLFGDGLGYFALATNSPIVMKDGQHPHTHGLELGDLNGDGKLDLITVNNEDSDLSLAFGDGRGRFVRSSSSSLAVGRSPYPLAVGDLNADGRLDIVSTSTAFTSRALTVLMGDGKVGFRRSDVTVRTPRPWFVSIGDVNGDRHPDLVATHSESSPLTVLLGDGRGGFREASASPFDLGHSAWGIALADMNGDGKIDVVAAASDGVRVMLGDGRGNFNPAPGSPFPTGKGAWRLAVGDLNGDGKPDVATSDSEGDSVSVLLAH